MLVFAQPSPEMDRYREVDRFSSSLLLDSPSRRIERASTGGLRRILPRGGMLPFDAWAPRHRWILKVLWFHVVALGVASLAKGNGLTHSLFEAGLVASFGVAAALVQYNRRASTLLAALGLFTSSAVLVHLFDGRIEMHFSYFVMVGIVTLYQDWLPLLASIGYVVLQHGIGGMVNASMVYDHSSAIEHPWGWAAVHGGFILAMSAVGLVSWRMNESFQARLTEREARLSEAQDVARLGSWQVDLVARKVEWSDQLASLLGIESEGLTPTLDAFLSHVDNNDRPQLEAAFFAALGTATPFACDFRVRASSGEMRWLHGRGDIKRVVDGKVAVISGTAQDITARKHAEIGLARDLVATECDTRLDCGRHSGGEHRRSRHEPQREIRQPVRAT